MRGPRDPLAEALGRSNLNPKKTMLDEEDDEEEEEEDDDEEEATEDPYATPIGPVLRRPKDSPPPLAWAITLSIIALAWNWYFSFFSLLRIVESVRDGTLAPIPVFFLSLFVLAGLSLLVAAIRAVLRLRNPRPQLTVSRGIPRLGGTFDVEWSFTGLPEKIRRLEITLEGREEATYRRGKSSKTAREVFLTLPVVETTEPMSIASGTARIAIPADTMHSFVAPSNRVVWSLKITGEIRRWPDIDETLEIVVLPQGGPQ